MAAKLDTTLFNMKLTSKQMQRESHNCEKREKEHTKKALAAMQKNNVVRRPGRAGAVAPRMVPRCLLAVLGACTEQQAPYTGGLVTSCHLHRLRCTVGATLDDARQ
jgi:hypothetical protein